MSQDLGLVYVYCLGRSSYEAGVTLPEGVFSTLELAQASVRLDPGEAWVFDADRHEWHVEEPGAHETDDVTLIRRYEIDAPAVESDA
jgi:hypothetical protein